MLQSASPSQPSHQHQQAAEWIMKLLQLWPPSWLVIFEDIHRSCLTQAAGSELQVYLCPFTGPLTLSAVHSDVWGIMPHVNSFQHKSFKISLSVIWGVNYTNITIHNIFYVNVVGSYTHFEVLRKPSNHFTVGHIHSPFKLWHSHSTKPHVPAYFILVLSKYRVKFQGSVTFHNLYFLLKE